MIPLGVVHGAGTPDDSKIGKDLSMDKGSSPETKVCNKCGESKSRDEFNKKQAMCRSCQKVHAKKYDEEHCEERRERDKKYYEEHREKVLAYQKKYSEEHREKICERTREWREKNLLAVHVRDTLASGRRRTLAAGGEVCEIPWRDAVRLLREPCAGCGGVANSLDHMIPTSRGGRHSVGNLIALCSPCNASKGNKTWMEWQVWSGTIPWIKSRELCLWQ